MDTLVKTLCVVSFVWLAGYSDDGCEYPGDPEPPDIGDVSDPNPRDGSIGVPFEPVLSWHIMYGEMDDDDFTYDVYFGTGEYLKNPPLVTENLDSNEYYTDTLNYGTMYSWRVVATEKVAYSPGDHRVSEGPLWSFTTYGGVIINEGFEGEFPPPGWPAESAWDQSDQSHTGESSARGTMTHYWSGRLLSPVFNIYQDSNGSIDLSFYYKREFPDRIPKLEFFINVSGGPDIELFSGWVDNDDWALAEYTVSRSDLPKLFRVVFRTHHYEPTSEDTSVLVDDVLVKFNALK